MKTSISDRTSPDSINGGRAVNPAPAGLGGWLFRHRTALPLPLALAILALPPDRAAGVRTVLSGVVVTAIGEAVRLWGVRHIGAISRTRSDRLGPLVTTGPFAYIRNPLYAGNLTVWAGFALTARLAWLAPIVLVVLGGEYHAIVGWEERLLDARHPGTFQAYARQVPRWIPALKGRLRRGSLDGMPSGSAPSLSAFSWRATLFSERGTLMAIAAGYVLLWLKARF